MPVTSREGKEKAREGGAADIMCGKTYANCSGLVKSAAQFISANCNLYPFKVIFLNSGKYFWTHDTPHYALLKKLLLKSAKMVFNFKDRLLRVI